MIKEKKIFVGGYKVREGQFHPNSNSPVVDWFTTNLEMPSRSAAVKWMKEKLKVGKKLGATYDFSYYETHSVRGVVCIEDGKISIK